MAEFERLGVLEALEESLRSASHLEPKHAATVGAARALAAKIDAWDVIVQWALEDASETTGQRPKVPVNDNTSLGTYSKYLEQLGLTVSAAKPAAVKPAEQSESAAPVVDESPGGKIIEMQRRAAERQAR